MRGRSSQNIWILVLLMLAGVVLGGFIANWSAVFLHSAGLHTATASGFPLRLC